MGVVTWHKCPNPGNLVTQEGHWWEAGAGGNREGWEGLGPVIQTPNAPDDLNVPQLCHQAPGVPTPHGATAAPHRTVMTVCVPLVPVAVCPCRLCARCPRRTWPSPMLGGAWPCVSSSSVCCAALLTAPGAASPPTAADLSTSQVTTIVPCAVSATLCPQHCVTNAVGTDTVSPTWHHQHCDTDSVTHTVSPTQCHLHFVSHSVTNTVTLRR